MKLGFSILGVLWVLAIAWVAFAAYAVFNLDPKFGGPTRWGFVVSPLFYLYGVAPAAHILAFAYAIRFRVRSMVFAQVRSGWDVGLLGAVVLLFLTYPIASDRSFPVVGNTDVSSFLILIYLAMALLIFRPSGRAFILPVVFVVICNIGFAASNFAFTEVTRNSEGTIVRIQDHSPRWSDQAKYGAMVLSTLLFCMAIAQIVISSFLGLVRLSKRRPGPA